MSEFTFPQVTLGSVTAPTNALAVTLPSAVSLSALPSAFAAHLYDGLPMSVVELQSLRGLAMANGREPIRIVTKGAVVDCGLLAPSATMTAAVAGAARATSTLNTNGTDFSNNDSILLGQQGGRVVTFKTTLDPTGLSGDQVLRGVSIDASLTALKALIEGTAGQGTAYVNSWQALSFPVYNFYADGAGGIEIASIDLANDDIVIRAVQYGAAGNLIWASQVVDAGGTYAFTGTTLAGGSDPTAGDPAAGTYRYGPQFYRDLDGAASGIGPIISITTTTDANIDLAVLTASLDTTVDYTRVLRTEHLGVEFFLDKTIARAANTVTDDVADVDLADSVPYAPEQFRDYTEGFPTKVRCLALWGDRLWGGGAILSADYTLGTAAVTISLATVTLTGAVPTQMWVGRTFKVAATSESYLILKVDMTVPAAPVLTLEREYVGSTNATASYTVRDARDPNAVYCSVDGLYNQWPFDNQPGSVQSDDAEGVTGFFATRGPLYASTPTTITEITGDDIESWQMHKVVDGVGWVAERCVVGTDMGLVFLSRVGVCLWPGQGDPRVVSSPATPKGRAAIGIEDTVARISWANVRQAFATYNRELRQVRFAVPLDGAEVPNHEIVLDLQNSTWSLFRRSAFTASCVASLPGGGQALLYGDREGVLWHADTGESDGAYDFDPLVTLTSTQTMRTLTASGASFPTSGDGLKGVPAIVLYADGTTAAMVKIASNTGTALTLAEDLATAPAAGDQVAVGGIWWRAKTGFYGKEEDYDRKQFRDTTLSHIPLAEGTYEYAYAIEGGAFTLCTVGDTQGDLTVSNGRRRFRPQTRAMNKADLIQGFLPGPAPTIRSVVNTIGIREKSNR